MSYGDGLGLLESGNAFGQDAATIQKAMGRGKRGQTKPINKLTFVLTRQQEGGYAATATVGGGFLGGGQKKQYGANNIGDLITQIGASTRKAFSFGMPLQAPPMQQPYPGPQSYQQPQLYPQTAPQQVPMPPYQQPQVIQTGLPPPVQYTQTPQPANGKVCASCGTGLADAVAFCGNCGSKYEAPAPKPAKAFCTNCGTPATGKFCNACGNAVAAPSA